MPKLLHFMHTYPKYAKMVTKQESLLHYCNLSQLSSCINFIKPFLDSTQLGYVSRWRCNLWTLPIHVKTFAIYVPKMQKNDHKTRYLALFVTSCAKIPQSTILGTRWHRYLPILHIYSKTGLELQNTQQIYLK